MFGKRSSGPDFPPGKKPNWDKVRADAVDAEFEHLPPNTPEEPEEDALPAGLGDVAPGESRKGPAPEAEAPEPERSDNHIRMAETGSVSAADWGAPEHGPSVEAMKAKLAGLVDQVQSLGKKGIEGAKQGVDALGEVPGKLPGYMSGRYAAGMEKVRGLLGKKTEQKESTATNAEKFAAYGKFLKERYTDKSLAEAGKQLGTDLLWLPREYNKLPPRTKLLIAGGFLAASAAFTLSGGSASWLVVPFVKMMTAKRIFGGTAAYTSTEAMLQKGGKYIPKIENAMVRHLVAGTFGALVGEGVVGAGGKWLFEHLGGENLVHSVAGIWSSHGNVPAADAVSHQTGASYAPEQVQVTPEAAHAPSLAAPETPSGAIAEASISKGEGAGQMFADLKEQLRAAGYSATNGSDAIRHIMNTRVVELAHEYGLGTMHAGDHLEINANGNPVFTPENGTARMLVGHAFEQQVTHAESLAGNTPEHSVSSLEAREELQTRALNLGQLEHPGVVDGHAVEVPHLDNPVTVHTPEVPSAEASPSGQTPQYLDMDGRPNMESPSFLNKDDAIKAFTDQSHLSDGTVIDSVVPHVYESAKGEYMFGGNADLLNQKAVDFAVQNKVSVFVNHSYTNALGARVVQVIEFPSGADAGGHALAPVLHTDPSYDIGPEAGFTKLIK